MTEKNFQVMFSIKWKMLILMLIVYFLPLTLFWLEAPGWLIALAGIMLSLVVTWWWHSRVVATRQRLERLESKLPQSAAKPLRSSAFADELTALVHTYDRFLTNLEETFSEMNTPTNMGTGPFRRDGTHTVYKAALSTGEPIVGEAAILPRRVDEDTDLVNQLTGDEAIEVFLASANQSREELTELRETAEIRPAEKGIIDFQIMLLQDKALMEGVAQCLSDKFTLPEALNTTFAVIVGKLESSANAYVKARATDFFDLKQRLFDNIYRQLRPEVNEFYETTREKVVFCESIYPTDVVALYKAGARGIVSVQGTASSHAEILLQSFNLPSLTNLEGLPIYMLQGRQALVDTVNKHLIIDPTPEQIENLTQPTRIHVQDVIREPVKLASGEPMRVMATINNVTIESRRALTAGADGVGLFRSEMSYIGRPDLPLENELYDEYRVLTDVFGDQPVAMRMLDLGSDKLAMFQQDDEHEENPCMGNRSMRLLIRRPDVFRTQLRAMLRASTRNTCILFPMISGWYELGKVRSMIDKITGELQNEGFTRVEKVQYGIMVEIPGIVERFADYVDEFDIFNIGSNDLTQYALAADRNNRNVSEYYSFYHPSVLSMIQKVCVLGAERRKVVRLCGEMCSDISMLPLVVGLGVREMSAHSYVIAKLKNGLRHLDLPSCEQLARAVLRRRSAEEARAEVELFLQSRMEATTP